VPTWITIRTYPGEPRWSTTAVLSGVDYRLDLDFHEREQRWFLDITRSTGEEIARGVKLVENWPLLRRVASRFKPPGVLVASARVGGPPLLHDLGTRVLLLYGVP
jgi:hypothetical protein